jgi:hypothetical protein
MTNNLSLSNKYKKYFRLLFTPDKFTCLHDFFALTYIAVNLFSPNTTHVYGMTYDWIGDGNKIAKGAMGICKPTYCATAWEWRLVK